MILLIRKLPWKMHPVLDLKPLGAQQEMESKILQFSVLMPRDVLPYVFTETIVSSREDRGVQFVDQAAVSYMNLERQNMPRWERSRSNLPLEIKRTGVCSTAGPRSSARRSATRCIRPPWNFSLELCRSNTGRKEWISERKIQYRARSSGSTEL